MWRSALAGGCSDSKRRVGRAAAGWLANFLLSASLFGAALPVSAQTPPRARVGAGLGVDLMLGDASDFLDRGTSRFLMADFRMDAADRLHIRLDASWSSLHDDEDELSGARAENDLVEVLTGPQITGRLGRFRPYAAVLGGLAVVHWRTEQPDAVTNVEEVRNDGGRGSFAYGGHAGIGLLLDEGNRPVTIQVEARLQDAGSFDFARAPDPSDTRIPTGLIRHDIGVFSVRIAVTLGF